LGGQVHHALGGIALVYLQLAVQPGVADRAHEGQDLVDGHLGAVREPHGQAPVAALVQTVDADAALQLHPLDVTAGHLPSQLDQPLSLRQRVAGDLTPGGVVAAYRPDDGGVWLGGGEVGEVAGGGLGRLAGPDQQNPPASVAGPVTSVQVRYPALDSVVQCSFARCRHPAVAEGVGEGVGARAVQDDLCLLDGFAAAWMAGQQPKRSVGSPRGADLVRLHQPGAADRLDARVEPHRPGGKCCGEPIGRVGELGAGRAAVAGRQVADGSSGQR